MASDQQLAPVHGATAKQKTKGRGALPKAYPKTAEGLQRLDADIKERGAKEVGARYGVTHHAVLQHGKRMRKALASNAAAAGGLIPSGKPRREHNQQRGALNTWQEIRELLEAEWHEERRLEDLDQHPWKRTLLPHCQELALLPIGGNKIPVDLQTGQKLQGWQGLSYSVEELAEPNGWLKALGYRPGAESGHIACVDVDGPAALNWLVALGARPEDAGWRTLRGEGRLKVHFRIPEELRAQLPQGKRVLQVVPKGGNGSPAQQIEFFNGTGQCVIAGLHPSGDIYCSEGSPTTVTEPNEAWTKALLEIVAKCQQAKLSQGEEPEERWQSGPGSPCPVCGRDTTSACTVWVTTDETPRLGVNCMHGQTFHPPSEIDMPGFGGRRALEKGDVVPCADGDRWVYSGQGQNPQIGTFSIFLQDRPMPVAPAAEEAAVDGGSAPVGDALGGRHFAILGWTDGKREHILYRAKTTGQIAEFKGKGNTELLRLAPLGHWVELFGRLPVRDDQRNPPGVLIGPPDWMEANSAVIETADSCGLFDRGTLRGLGVWMDGEDVVWHLGDYLEVNGKLATLDAHSGRYQYVREPALRVDREVPPLSDAEGEAVISHLQRMGWATPLDPLHMSGWIVLALVGGALNKRPGAQITSPTGTGKSDLVTGVILVLLAGVVVYSTGSSEAGVRQKLGCSSLPVVLDESEQENARQRDHHLRFARFSYDGVGQVKGTPGGEPLEFAVRSSVCLVGINASIPNPAERNRIVVIGRRHLPAEQWEAVMREREEVITPEVGERLLRRVVTNLTTLLSNVRTFGRVVSAIYGGRIGDTYGALLAGAHLLTSLDVLDEIQARVWIEAHGWSLDDEALVETSAQAVAEQCLEHLLKAEVPFTEDTIIDARGNTTIRQLIKYLIVCGGAYAAGCGETSLRHGEKVLGRRGIKVDLKRGSLLIHTGIRGSLSDLYAPTRWANGAFNERLRDLPGAEGTVGAKWINPLGTVKCMALPLEMFKDERDFSKAEYQDGSFRD